MENLPDRCESVIDSDPPVSAGPLDDSDEEGTPGLPNLAFGDGALHEAQGLEDDVLRDRRCQPSVVAFAFGVVEDRQHLVYEILLLGL